MDYINSYFGNHALSNIEIDLFAKRYRIKYWRGVYMRDSLPKKIRRNESAVVNLDSKNRPGTHWVCYFKKGDIVWYMDSFGVCPTVELIKYFGKNSTVIYSSERIQGFDAINCGHLCLQFLIEHSK